MPEVKLPIPVLEVPYVYLNAEQVAALQAKVREDKRWETDHWGNYGPDGKQRLQVKTFADCDTDHLEAILITQPQITPLQRATILELLKVRYKEQDDETR